MIATVLMLLAAQDAAPVNPAAIELFDRDPVLSAWALGSHDINQDGWLTSFEAQAAAEAFRDLADANSDGRVTVREYQEAKRFLVARRGSSEPAEPAAAAAP